MLRVWVAISASTPSPSPSITPSDVAGKVHTGLWVLVGGLVILLLVIGIGSKRGEI